jgi:HlyD family secretion protein
MDKRIEKKSVLAKIIAAVAGAAVLLVAVYVLSPGSGRMLDVEKADILLSEVKRTKFEDLVVIRGIAEPKEVLIIDSIYGGRVESIHIQNGQSVKEGEPLVTLSNTQLQLDVISRQAQITEQENYRRTIELNLERNRLSHEREILQTDYRIEDLRDRITRFELLKDKRLISDRQFVEMQKEFDHLRRLRTLLESARVTDLALQTQQLQELKAAGLKLTESLEVTLAAIENLNVRAPIAGQLTSFDIKVGQLLERGVRIGQIDSLGDYKVMSAIDEFYLGKVQVGMTAEYPYENKIYKLSVSRIDPQVAENRFRVELVFDGELPPDLQRGKALNMNLRFGKSRDSLVVENGPFYQSSGGNWAFVVAPGQSTAVKRSIRLGQQNSRYIEVLDGLSVGDRVIKSSYEKYTDIDVISIDGL